MLFQKGINWNDNPVFFKRGTYVQRQEVERALLPEDLDRLPPKHEARRNPQLRIKRSAVQALSLPRIRQIENREALVCEAAQPQLRS